jgi:hypothetical protein
LSLLRPADASVLSEKATPFTKTSVPGLVELVIISAVLPAEVDAEAKAYSNVFLLNFST